MLNVNKMIASAEEALGWPYVTPGSNNEDGIDCSGLFVKIYRDQGASIYHGSNRIFRVYCGETGKLTNISQLQPGMAVFKWQNRQPKGYSDDLGDFHHIGLVVSVYPLRIIHASSVKGFVTTDTTTGKWAYWGKLKNVNYSSKSERSEEKMPEGLNTDMFATITANQGTTVKMRAKPSTSSSKYWDIPIGATVTVLEKGNDWSKIQVGARVGYMMSQFLVFENAPPANEDKMLYISEKELKKAYDIIEGLLKQLIVNKGDLEKAYDIIGDLLGLRG